MREFLIKTDSGNYIYTKNVSDVAADQVIEIPEGADTAGFSKLNNEIIFFKDENYQFDKKWIQCGIEDKDGTTYNDLKSFLDWGFGNEIIWQRSQPEELPFIDDEPKSLNDQYAEIEQVRQDSIVSTLNERQSQYGDFSDVAKTARALSDLAINDNFTDTQRMAMYMICSKIARIVNGDHNHKDSWHDIAGYATLVDKELK